MHSNGRCLNYNHGRQTRRCVFVLRAVTGSMLENDVKETHTVWIVVSNS